MSDPEQKPGHCDQEQPDITLTQSVVIGSVAGAAEVLINHPLWSIKTIMQSLPKGASLPFTPLTWYRGIIPNTISMAPITAMQVGLDNGFQKVFFAHSTKPSNYQLIMSAFVAGAGSAVLSCPTEMIMSHQTNATPDFYGAARYIIKERGMRALFTSLPATAMRESLFTVFFLAATPMFKTKIQPYWHNDMAATFAAGTIAGVCASLLTQGADTIKTVQQKADLSRPIDFFAAARQVYATQNIYGFFRGGLPRVARVASAVAIMGCAAEKMKEQIHHYNARVDEGEERKFSRH